MVNLGRVLLGTLFLIIVFFGVTASLAPPPPPPEPPPPAVSAPPGEALRAAWWADQRWRYRNDADARAAYNVLVSRQSPWPEWHQPHLVILAAGQRFQMALAPGQSPDSPGAFGTFDAIPDVEYVRRTMAVKTAWKPAIDRVVTYEIIAPLLADVGTIGPQVDAQANRYLPGGGSQFQMMIPAAERLQHLRVVEVRPIQ